MRMSRATAVVLAVLAGVLAWAGSSGHASHLKEQPRKHRVVYHLDEAPVEKARFVLGNIRNTIDGVGGWQHIEAIELVVNGPALKNFVTRDMDGDLRRALAALQDRGLVLAACGNTMAGLKITTAELPEGAHYLPQGGVVRVMELQEQGYSYIRP